MTAAVMVTVILDMLLVVLKPAVDVLYDYNRVFNRRNGVKHHASAGTG